jgi:small subunit ribosomal protein S26e
LVDRRLLKELQNQGARIARTKRVQYLCISCAVHRGVVKVRSKVDRRSSPNRRSIRL